ncbi:uncharacterized protein [Epargyreus clarus]|uniref:uncharacterized protein n=1 Tax=Epargyreus clarus TaxID=520877 RepID=UPI003C2F9089
MNNTPCNESARSGLVENRENELPSINEVAGREEDNYEGIDNNESNKELKEKESFRESHDDIIESYKCLKEKDLEIRASKKFVSSSHTKSPYHKSRFTSTWVQYQGSDDGEGGGTDYDPETQNPFLRIVFIIVLVMLIITCIFNYNCMEIKPTYSYEQNLKTFFEGKSSLFLVIPVACLMIFQNCLTFGFERTRSSPFIYIFLVLTLVATCIVSGFISGQFNTLLVTLFYITSGIIVIAFIILTFLGFDFTNWFLYLIVLALAVPTAFVFALLSQNNSIEQRTRDDQYPIPMLVLFFVGTVVNCLIMTIMLQILLSGKAVEMGDNDYALAAFFLYTSIFDIYFKILQLLSHLCSSEKSEESD